MRVKKNQQQAWFMRGSERAEWQQNTVRHQNDTLGQGEGSAGKALAASFGNLCLLHETFMCMETTSKPSSGLHMYMEAHTSYIHIHMT